MSDSAPPATPELAPRSRRATTITLRLGHALFFAALALALPWGSTSLLGFGLWALSILHAVTAVTLLLRNARLQLWSVRALTLGSALGFVGFTAWLGAAAAYVSHLYGGLGTSIAVGLSVLVGLLGLATLPVAISHYRAAFGQSSALPPSGREVVAALLVLSGLGLPIGAHAASGRSAPGQGDDVGRAVQTELERFARARERGPSERLRRKSAARCEHPLESERERASVLVTFVNLDGKTESACLQAGPPEIGASLRRLLKRASNKSPLVADLVVRTSRLSSGLPAFDALKLRPGQDGACSHDRCLAPWQLVMRGEFGRYHPLPNAAEVNYGFSAKSLRTALGEPKPRRASAGGLVRIETQSFAVENGAVESLSRTRIAPPPFEKATLEAAVANAERHIEHAQEDDGTFRYTLDPETGKADTATLNLPRQAGTAFALCEHGRASERKQVVARALGVFGPYERGFGELSALENGTGYGLGKSALPLLALLRCRDLVGADNDRLIGQLARLLLTLQRPDGGFYSEFDPRTRQGAGRGEVMYAAGQAVLSLVLLEQALPALRGTPAEPLPAPALLRRALDRAMSFYGGPYWPAPLRDLVIIEEGWHCLAAKAALTSHRHDAYERFCLDYVGSRARWVVPTGGTKEPAFVGGMGVTGVFPPRNTATSGYCEALNAAIAIKRARGENDDEQVALLRLMLKFLLRAQWQPRSCYACARPELVIGGFSEHLASPVLRIDYAQHAMAAIGGAAPLLAWAERAPRSAPSAL